MTEYFNRTSQKARRQELRNKMPAAEVLLWSRLRGRQLLDCKVLRFLNPDVYDNLDGVLEVIAEQVRARRGATSPPPAPPSQGGEKSGASQGGE